MQVKLSPRLAAIAEYVPEGAIVADIGTDHGYLPVHLMTQNISPRVIASDVHQKPLNSAVELVEMLNLSKKIDLRMGNGLEVLEPGEAEVAILAGMGGSTMIEIFNRSPKILSSLKRLLLQPMQGASNARKWLMENNFSIIDEKLVQDDGIIYEIIVAEPGKANYSFEEIFIGPHLLDKKPPLLKSYLQCRYQHLYDIIEEMNKSNSEKTEFKKKEYQERMEILHKVIVCL